MEIKSTKNYKQFEFVQSNRDIDEAHLKRLKEAIMEKNMLSLTPIIVNQKMEVIDGQHRLKAAEQLGVEIYYLMDTGIGESEMSALNAIKKNWKLEDYLNHYMIVGKPEYKKVGAFVRSHSNIPLSAAILLLGADYGGLTKDFRRGAFVVANLDDANQISKEIEKLSELGSSIGKFIYSTGFIRVYSAVRKHDKFQFQKLVDQIQKQPRGFVPCSGNKQYLEMFHEFYNRDVRQENRLTFSLKD